MPLLTRVVGTPLTVEIGSGTVRRLAPLLADNRISAGGHVAVVVGPGLGQEIAEALRPGLGNAELWPWVSTPRTLNGTPCEASTCAAPADPAARTSSADGPATRPDVAFAESGAAFSRRTGRADLPRTACGRGRL